MFSNLESVCTDSEDPWLSPEGGENRRFFKMYTFSAFGEVTSLAQLAELNQYISSGEDLITLLK